MVATRKSRFDSSLKWIMSLVKKIPSLLKPGFGDFLYQKKEDFIYREKVYSSY
jgi:hypothetical protein